MPIIPATQEAEAGETLEPGRWRLQLAKIAPLHSTMGDRVRRYLKTNRQTKNHTRARTHTHTHTHTKGDTGIPAQPMDLKLHVKLQMIFSFNSELRKK